MDGYAVRAPTISPPAGTSSPVSQRIPAGSVGGTWRRARRRGIFTGAPVRPAPMRS